MSPFVRTVRAHEGEIVEIAWYLTDGSVFCQRFTVPPKEVREARMTIADVEQRRKDEAAP